MTAGVQVCVSVQEDGHVGFIQILNLSQEFPIHDLSKEISFWSLKAPVPSPLWMSHLNPG